MPQMFNLRKLPPAVRETMTFSSTNEDTGRLKMQEMQNGHWKLNTSESILFNIKKPHLKFITLSCNFISVEIPIIFKRILYAEICLWMRIFNFRRFI